MTSFSGAMETAMEQSDSESGDQINLSESAASLSGTPTRHKSRPNEHVRRVRRTRKSASLHAADESEYDKSLSQLQHSASALSTNSHTAIGSSPLRAAGSKPPPPASAPDKPPPPPSPGPSTTAVSNLTTKSQLTTRMSSPNLAVNKDNNTANNNNNNGNNTTHTAIAAARAHAKSSATAPAGSDKASSTSPPLPLPTKVTSLQNAIGTFKRGSNRVRSIFGRSKSSAAADDDDDPPSNRDDGAHSAGPAPHAAGAGGSNPASSTSSPSGTLNSKRQSGTFSNLTDSADGDMMFRAAQAGDYEAVHFLLDECVDDAARKKLVGSVNSRLQTALVLAATNGFDEICRMLIEVDHTLMGRADRTGWSALHYAASEKRISTAMLLVRKGHDPNIRNDEGSTPLHYAIRIGPRHQTEDLLDLLEDHGADLDAQTRHGETALHQAAFRGNFANAGWLLAHGATPNLIDKHGHTALHKAAMLGHKHAATVLLDHGVDRAVKANNGQTARDVAVEFKQAEIVEYLDEYERSVADAAHRRSLPSATPQYTNPNAAADGAEADENTEHDDATTAAGAADAPPMLGSQPSMLSALDLPSMLASVADGSLAGSIESEALWTPAALEDAEQSADSESTDLSDAPSRKRLSRAQNSTSSGSVSVSESPLRALSSGGGTGALLADYDDPTDPTAAPLSASSSRPRLQRQNDRAAVTAAVSSFASEVRNDPTRLMPHVPIGAPNVTRVAGFARELGSYNYQLTILRDARALTIERTADDYARLFKPYLHVHYCGYVEFKGKQEPVLLTVRVDTNASNSVIGSVGGSTADPTVLDTGGVGGGDDGAHSVAVPLGAAASTASYLCLLWTKRWNKLIKVPAPGGISSTFSNPSKEFKRALTTVCQRAELFCGIGDKLRFSIAPIPEEVDIRKQCSFAEETDPQKSKLHCIGIVYASPQHTTEEQIFSENNASPAFWEFVEWLGERVRLKGWKGYRGDLDVRTDTTGRYSYSARLGEHEVMFHVAPMLPQGKEHLLVRKRRIGNDMTTIVFQDGGAYTPPIESQVLHNYVVVSPIVYKGTTFYKISVSRRVSVEKFGPPLVLPSVYEKCETLRVYLLTKLINANFAAMRSPGLASKIAVPAKQKFLADLIADHYSKK